MIMNQSLFLFLIVFCFDSGLSWSVRAPADGTWERIDRYNHSIPCAEGFEVVAGIDYNEKILVGRYQGSDGNDNFTMSLLYDTIDRKVKPSFYHDGNQTWYVMGSFECDIYCLKPTGNVAWKPVDLANGLPDFFIPGSSHNGEDTAICRVIYNQERETGVVALGWVDPVSKTCKFGTNGGHKGSTRIAEVLIHVPT